jgi:hypothetical protein
MRSDESFSQSQMQIVEMAREISKGFILEKAMYHGVDFKVTVDAIPGRV